MAAAMLILRRYLLFCIVNMMVLSRRNMNARAYLVLYTVIAIQLKRAYTTFDREDNSL